MRNEGSRMPRSVSWKTSLLFITTYSLGCVTFNLFLDWYDTGVFSGAGVLLVVVVGFVLGGIALQIEKRLYHRYGFWPQSRCLFFLRLTLLSALYIAMSTAVSSGAMVVLEQVINDSGFLVILQGVALSLAIGLFYWLLAIPFGAVVSAIINLLLRSNGRWVN